MNNTELLRQLREPPSEARAHWHRAMRLVMSLRSSDDGKIDWESADLEVDDSPVEPATWQAWLRSEPAHVWLMTSLLELEVARPGIPTFEDVLRFVLEHVPSLARRFVASHSNPVRAAIEREHGAALGRAADGQRALEWGTLDNDELVGGWLAARLAQRPKAHLNPYTLTELSRRERLTGALAAVYPKLALAVLRSVRKGNTSELSLRSDWLTADELLAILEALRSKTANLDVVMGMTVEQGTEHGLDAIAGLLADKKVGGEAVFWLACAGHAGLRAARSRWATRKGAAAKVANARIEELSALPLGNPPTSGPRFTLASDLGPWEPTRAQRDFDGPRVPPEPAIARDTVTAMCAGFTSPAASKNDLSPAEWADYLQVASMDENLVQPGPTWDRAREAGWLGRGASRASLAAAAARLNPKGRTHWNTRAPLAWGELFLWAGADRDSYVDAIALVLRNAQVRRTMGWVETHFIAPLESSEVPWAGDVSDWLGRIRQGRPLLGPEDQRPVGEVVVWDARRHALRAEVPAKGCAKLTLGEQTIVIEPDAGTMTLSGPVEGVRRFPPTERTLPTVVTRSDGGVLLTIGSVAWGEIDTRADELEAEGLTSVALHREMQAIWPALDALLRGHADGAASLAASESPEAARLLALVATLRPTCQPEAVAAALAQLGTHAAAFRAALGLEGEAPKLPDWSFEEVVSALEANTGGAPQRQAEWTWARGHGVRRGGFVGPALTLLDASSSPSAEELRSLAERCPLYPGPARAEHLQAREALGVHEATWTLVPEEGGFGNGPLFYQLHAASWPVRDGRALAIWSGYDVPSIHWLLGVPFLPAAPWRAA